MFKGNIIFNEDLLSEKTDKQLSAQLYEMRRNNTYLGSRMHFFRALWADDLISAGFTVKNSADEYLSYKDIVRQEDSYRPDSLDRYEKYIKYSGNLSIYYTGISTIIFLKPRVYFNIDGNFDNTAITWEGEMLIKRIGDLLPYEYSESGNYNR